MRPVMKMKSLVLVALALAAGCGKGDGDKRPVEKAITVGDGKGPALEPPRARAIGLEQVAAWNYLYGKGGKDIAVKECVLMQS